MKKTLVWFGLQVVLHVAESLGLWRWWPLIVGSGGFLVFLPHLAAAVALTIWVFREELTRRRFISWLAVQLVIYVIARLAMDPFRPDMTVYAMYVVAAVAVTWMILGREADRRRVEMSAPGSANPFFRCPAFSLEIDDAAGTFRLRGVTQSWTDGRESAADVQWTDYPKGKGTVEHQLPLSGLSHSTRVEEVTRSVAQVATGMATGTAVVNGQVLPVSAPVSVTTGYTHYSEATENNSLSFTWRKTTYEAKGVKVSRGRDGAITRAGYANKASNFKQTLTLHFKGIQEKVSTAFEKEFWPQVDARIKSLEKAAEAAALDAAWAEAERRFLDVEAQAKAQSLEREAASKAAAEAALAAARAERLALIEGSGIQGDFEAWQYDAASGKIAWLVQVDHSGAALVAGGAQERWVGSLTGAKVQRVAMEKYPAEQELLVEVRDPAYEALHLKRRRFRVLGGRNATVLTEWVDRVEILSAR